MTSILGISAFYHDSAAAIIVDGEIIAAAQEERFTRVKHDSSYPEHAINYCLTAAALKIDKVDHIVFYDKPFLKFERLLETYVSVAPRGLFSFLKSMPIWMREKLFMKNMLIKKLRAHNNTTDLSKKLLFTEHHLSHAASAYYPSPFDAAVVLTLDGVGEWATTTVSIASGNKLEIVREIHFPHSLGLLFSAFTAYIGFKVNSGEYKVMGLAPYGEPRFADLILQEIVDVKSDGTFHLNMSYFNYMTGLTMTSKKFAKLFGQPIRLAESELSQFHMDIAASIQVVMEKIIRSLAISLAKEFNIPNLCLAGGVALNCVVNGKVLADGAFDGIWIQPAAGDAGGAVGAALAVWHLHLDAPRRPKKSDGMKGTFLGPEFSSAEIEAALLRCGAKFVELEAERAIDVAASAIVTGKTIGWFQGRMEFGPRALGARSILADARSPKIQSQLNLAIKFRESFRPFAPSVLSEDVEEWFHFDQESPYMLFVAKVAESQRIQLPENESQLFGIDKMKIPRSSIPAVTHVDYTARVQTVDHERNDHYYRLISAVKEKTGCGVIVNTSFNIRGEPIVCTPEDAFNCFMSNGLDLLIIGNFVVNKYDQKN